MAKSPSEKSVPSEPDDSSTNQPAFPDIPLSKFDQVNSGETPAPPPPRDELPPIPFKPSPRNSSSASGATPHPVDPTPLWEKPIPSAGQDDDDAEKTTHGTPKVVVRKRLDVDPEPAAPDQVDELRDQVLSTTDTAPPRAFTTARAKKRMSQDTAQLLLLLLMILLGFIVVFTIWCLLNIETVQDYVRSFWST